jgi:hypothetical protein
LLPEGWKLESVYWLDHMGLVYARIRTEGDVITGHPNKTEPLARLDAIVQVWQHEQSKEIV